MINKEVDPTGKSKHESGAKLDAYKPAAGVLADFGMALMAVAKVGTGGIAKYTRRGWQDVPNAIERYEDALWRHLLIKKYIKVDPDFGLLHLAHLVWDGLATLEKELTAMYTTEEEVQAFFTSLPDEIIKLMETKRESLEKMKDEDKPQPADLQILIDAEGIKSFGQAISTLVTQELIKQKRPGGLLQNESIGEGKDLK